MNITLSDLRGHQYMDVNQISLSGCSSGTHTIYVRGVDGTVMQALPVRKRIKLDKSVSCNALSLRYVLQTVG
jgi:hypothetical protein